MSLAIKQSKANVGRSMQSGYMLSRRAYMGDPGLFGFLGKAAGSILGVASKVLPGPAGIAAGAIGGAIGGSAAKSGASAFFGKITGTQGISGMSGGGPGGAAFLPVPQQTPMVPTPGFGGAVARVLPGGSSGYQPAGPAPSGYHWNKSDYFLKDGTFVPAGSRLVKNRRRNPLNPRAASRAISRLESAKKATKRLDRISVKCRRCGYAACRCK